MIGGKALPLVVSDNCGFTSAVLLNRPDSLGLVAANVVEEVNSEDHVVLEQACLLEIVLYVSKVRVVRKIESLLMRQTLESIVSSDFMSIGQFYGTLRENMAVVLDGKHCVVKSVELCQISRDKVLIRVLFLTRSKGVNGHFFLGNGLFGSFLSFGVHFGFNLDKHFGGITGEESNQSVVLFFMLIVHRLERLENEVGRGGPEEALLRELVLVGVGDAHGDEVVLVLANNLAPEEKLLEVVVSR